jgi:hypothetical protein
MASPYDFLLQLMQGGNQFGGDVQRQRDLIGGIGGNADLLAGFQPGQQAFQQLMGFNPQMSQDVRSTMMGAAQNPFGTGAGQSTLNEALQSGFRTDVGGLAQANDIRSQQQLRDFTSSAQNRANLQGGLAGSGMGASIANQAGRLAQSNAANVLQSQVGADEAAANRRMGALGEARAGQALAGGLAGQVGGLENQLSGQRLGALGQAGGLEGQASGQRLAALQSQGQLGLQEQLGRTNANQNLLNFQGQFGGLGMSPDQALKFQNQAANNFSQQGLADRVRNMNIGSGGGGGRPAAAPTINISGGGGGGGSDKGLQGIGNDLDMRRFLEARRRQNSPGFGGGGLARPLLDSPDLASEMGRNPVAGAEAQAFFGDPRITQVLTQLFGQQASGLASLLG